MAWTQIRVANPTRAKRSFFTLEGRKDKRAKSGTRTVGYQIWHGSPETGRAISRKYRRTKRKSSGLRLNPNIFTDLLAGDIASKVSKSVISSLTGGGRKKKSKPRRRRRNARSSSGLRVPRQVTTILKAFSPEGSKKKYTQRRYICVDSKKVPVRKAKKNPHLALIGANPKRKRKTTMARRRRKNTLRGRKRNAKGQLMKMTNPRRRRRNKVSRRRRNVAALANPRRRRRRNRVRVVTKIKYRTRRANVAKRRSRKRKSVRRRSRRRNTVAAVANPRRRRRSRRRRNVAVANPRRRRRVSRRRRRNTARRNPSFGGLLGRLNIMQVAEVGIGVIAGDKLATWGGDKVSAMVGVTDPLMSGLIKAGIGIVGAGFISKFRPALALGLAAGAVNGLLNQYVFTPYISPYLPMSGMRGLGEYQDRTWKMDNWLAAGGAPGALAGMGANSLNRSSL